LRHENFNARPPGEKSPNANRTVEITRVAQPKSLIPSADQRGAKLLMRKPDVKVPSSHSAPNPKPESEIRQIANDPRSKAHREKSGI